MGVKIDKFISALKAINTIMLKDTAAGLFWQYFNGKRSEPTFAATRKAGKRWTNCFGGPAFAHKRAKTVPSEGLGWYFVKGGIHFLSKEDEKNFYEYFDLIKIEGKKTVKQAMKDGTMQKGDMVGYMSIGHTNVYLGNGKSFDSGHAFCEGSGEGARYKKWIGPTPYQGYKIWGLARLKEADPPKKVQYMVTVTKDSKLRKGPGVKYDALSDLTKREKVGVCDIVVNAGGNTWYYVRYGKTYGYVLGSRVVKK